jgi:pimeloyl-ACP methyl ester carboxylesterase
MSVPVAPLPGIADPAWTEYRVPRAGHSIWAARRPGAGPTVVFIHGFPDNHHLYDEVTPLLPGYDLVVMDFLGFGDSDRPKDHPYTFAGLVADIDAVVTRLGLDRIVFVPHDISGPPVIDWTLENPGRTAGLVLLNTYYGPSPTMTPPEIIGVLSAPLGRPVQAVVRAIASFPLWFEPVYRLQLRRMIGDRRASDRFLPSLVAPFKGRDSQWRAFTALADDMSRAMAAERGRVPSLRDLDIPVMVAFGADDYSLDMGVARHLMGLFPRAADETIPGSRHFPQLSDPAAVADRVRRMVAAVS